MLGACSSGPENVTLTGTTFGIFFKMSERDANEPTAFRIGCDCCRFARPAVAAGPCAGRRPAGFQRGQGFGVANARRRYSLSRITRRSGAQGGVFPARSRSKDIMEQPAGRSCSARRRECGGNRPAKQAPTPRFAPRLYKQPRLPQDCGDHAPRRSSTDRGAGISAAQSSKAESWAQRHREHGIGNYWVAMFGEPVRGKPWAWLLTGHHLGATFTCAGGRVAAAPLFLGAQPLEDLTGPYAGFTVLSHEGLRGLDLVSSLHPEQARVAVLSTEPGFSDVLTGVGRRDSLSRFEGLPAGDLDPPQQRLLHALVDEYVRNADFDAAERHLDAIQRAGLDQLHFSWRGPTNDIRSPFYYRIHGPRLIIEFAVQEPNHIHTIMRDPQNDYGMDWLGLHYEEHAWSAR